MKILYVSKVLSIHDYPFLQKLSLSVHEVLLFSVMNSRIPEPISGLTGIRFMTFSLPRPRSDYRFYLSLRSILLALIRIFYLLIDNLGFHDKVFSDRTIRSHVSFRIFYYFKKLSRVIRSFKPDVIHACWVQMDGLIAALTGFESILQMPWGRKWIKTYDHPRGKVQIWERK